MYKSSSDEELICSFNIFKLAPKNPKLPSNALIKKQETWQLYIHVSENNANAVIFRHWVTLEK